VKAGGLQILRCQRIAVGNYSFTLDALPLKPSDFFNVVVPSYIRIKNLKLDFKKCKKNVTGKKPVTSPKTLFSSENISSEGFQNGLLMLAIQTGCFALGCK
jgi:hypothetical protein